MKERQTTLGLSTSTSAMTAFLAISVATSSETVELTPALLYGDKQSLADLQ